VPLTILRGLGDPIMSAADAEAWRALGTRRVDVLTFPGDHFFVQQARDAVVAAVARTLAAPGTPPVA
jgi:surfactin synthase thioesterase subunit